MKKVILEGNQVFSTAELEKYYAGAIGREISLAELKAVTEAITAHYRSRGYMLSIAYLPPQKIEDGTVRIQVLEGKIGQIRVEGNRHFSENVYQEAITLRGDRVFRYHDLENDLYALNQNPDRFATAYLVPTDRPDTFDLALKAVETWPFHAHYTFSNTGTPLTHRGRHYADMTHNNLTGRGDSLNASFAMATEGALTAGSVFYLYPIQRTGTALQVIASHVRTHLIGPLKPDNVRGKSWSVSPGLTQNFIRTAAQTLDAFIGLDVKDSKTEVDGFKVNYDRTRVLRTGPRWTLRDSGGRTRLAADANIGLPDFMEGLESVDPDASEPNSGGEFTYYTIDASRVQRLPFSSYLLLRGEAQWTDDHLTSSEQFRAGGASSVRGYAESDSSGDYGYNASAELNLPIPWSQALRAVVFCDAAKTFLRDRTTDDAVKDRFLLGAGFGLRFDFGEHFSLRCDLGFPVGDKSADSQNPHAHIFVRGGF